MKAILFLPIILLLSCNFDKTSKQTLKTQNPVNLELLEDDPVNFYDIFFLELGRNTTDIMISNIDSLYTLTDLDDYFNSLEQSEIAQSFDQKISQIQRKKDSLLYQVRVSDSIKNIFTKDSLRKKSVSYGFSRPFFIEDGTCFTFWYQRLGKSHSSEGIVVFSKQKKGVWEVERTETFKHSTIGWPGKSSLDSIPE